MASEQQVGGHPNSVRIERRYKLLRVDPTALIRMLNGQGFALPVNKEIPEGCQVVSVMADYLCDSLTLKIHHPSFPVVPVGNVLPYVTDGCSLLELASVCRWRTYSEERPLHEGDYLARLSTGRYVVAQWRQIGLTETLYAWQYAFPVDEDGHFDDTEAVVAWTTIPE